jgi:Putative adhesin
MERQTMGSRGVLGVLGAVLFFGGAVAALAGTSEEQEKHFKVTGRPVVTLNNIVNGRIEVKSWKNPEVVVTSSAVPGKVSVDAEQVGDRIEINAASLTADSSQPHEVEANFQLVVPEETELQLRTQTGLILVEQVNGDMKLQSVAGDVHLKEVSGYVIVKTASGSLVCTGCTGKLDFNSISGSAQILQSSPTSLNLMTTTGNILYDGEFRRMGLYTMNSGRGLVEVRFSRMDSFDLKASTYRGTVDNQASEVLRPDTHSRHSLSSMAKSLWVTMGQGSARVEVSSYSGTIRIVKRD